MIVKANQLFKSGDIQQAEKLYRQLLRQNPNDIDALWGLGKVALSLDSYQASYDIFSRCVKLVDSVPQLWLSLSQVCEKLRRFSETEQALINAVNLNEEYLPSLEAISIYYCQANQLKKANVFLDKVLTLSPGNPKAFALKVRINNKTSFDDEANNILSRLENTEDCEFSHNEQILLHYAFAELYQRAGQVADAYNHFQQANTKQRKLVDYSVDDMKEYFNQLIETFSPSLFAKFISLSPQMTSDSTLTPIFIIGQPRSGSTLLEQMLNAHSEISTAGELPFLAGDIAQGIYQLTGQHFPKGCQKLTLKQCQSLGQHYLKSMQIIAPDANYIIDKMPANYQSVGLIKMLLPNAKIIHISRNVKDVSWSIYSNYFAANEPNFCSFEDIALYHLHYENVMRHWNEVLPDFCHHIDYESLVQTPQKELSNILSYCGLDFQPSCLSFNSQNTYIATLSDVQLRKGIQKKKSNAWEQYQEYLPECFVELS